MKTFKNILKTVCLVLAIACMSFAFAGCGETPTEGIFDIKACRTAYNNHDYTTYDLKTSCVDTENYNRYVEEAKTASDENVRNAKKRFANRILVANWGKDLSTSPFAKEEATLYKRESDKPKKATKVNSMKIESQFILDNASKFTSTSFIAVNGSSTIFVINLTDGRYKYKPAAERDDNGNIVYTTDEAEFIANAKAPANSTYTAKDFNGNPVKDSNGKEVKYPCGGFTSYCLIKNKDETKNPNRFDIVLGASSIPSDIYNWGGNVTSQK